MRLLMWATALGLAVAVASAAEAQELASAGTSRGPRFLLATPSRATVPLDVTRAPLLKRRITLELAGVTLKQALEAVSDGVGLDLAYSPDAIPLDRQVTLHAHALSVAAILTDLLLDAGVDVVFSQDGRATLIRRGPSQAGVVQGRATDGKTGSGIVGVDVSLEGTETRATTDTAGRYRLADVTPGSYTLLARRIGYAPLRRAVTVAAGEETAADLTFQAQPTLLGDVVVTAQKREERLLTTPQSVTVLSADALKHTGAVQFRDFATRVPGLTFMTFGAGNTQISLRGTTIGFDISQTVGIYIDEVPYGSSVGFGSSASLALDVGLFDLDRIEVLRGPQGTLYGASTMGGLIKYVTKRPDASRFGMEAQSGVSGTGDGGASYHGAATLNTPIVTNKVALRTSGFYSRDGGYVDNITLGDKNVDQSEVYGGRADLLFAPSDAVTVRVTGFLQNISRDGLAVADYSLTGVPVDGSLDQHRFLAEPFYQRFRLASGAVDYDLGWGTLTSVSSYQTVRSGTVTDLSLGYAPLCAIFLTFSCSTLGLPNDFATDKFTQEVRLASQLGRGWEWRLGTFYTHQNNEDAAAFTLRDAAGQPAPNGLFTYFVPSRYREYAAFGDLTWHLADKFDVTGGIRYARNHQRSEQIGTGIFGRSTPVNRSSDDVFTYLANARYHFSDLAMGYVRYATGYRPGGPNAVTIDAGTGLPVGLPTFGPDRLKSYEVGMKAETADRRVGVDVAAYYIDWNDVQINFVRGGFGAIGNAPGGATVRGAELGLTARPLQSLTLTGAFAYQNARMSEADADLGAAKGDRMPNVPRFTSTVNADYELSIRSFEPTIGATVNHMGERLASFSNRLGFPQYRLPQYTTVDVRLGFGVGRSNVQVYARNLFDERGQLSAPTNTGEARAAILQPRTIGVMASTRF